jgi:2,3-bisphosphoglycerate-dependent phosphoglycerate mutase
MTLLKTRQMTSLYLVRHAHADWSPDDGRPLSTRGRRDATTLVDLLSTAPITAIYSSPSRRALETVQVLAEQRRIDPVIVADLRERTLVVPPGMDFERAVKTAWGDPASTTPGGESNTLAQARGLAAIHTILAEQPHGHSVVATHGNLLALILNGLKPTYGFEFWRNLTFPDVYELKFEQTALTNVRRVWRI